MRQTITISACRRPEALEMTLRALRACDGFSGWDARVLVDRDPLTEANLYVAQSLGFESSQFQTKVGCNRMVRACMEVGFGVGETGYHVHIEDDTVPTAGFLRFHEWARDAFGRDKGVISTSGYCRAQGHSPVEYLRTPFFCGWAWGTWADRWPEFEKAWPVDDAVSWDVVIERTVRGSRSMIHPAVSRIQNIGRDNGTYCKDHNVYWTEHWTPETSDAIVLHYHRPLNGDVSRSPSTHEEKKA